MCTHVWRCIDAGMQACVSPHVVFTNLWDVLVCESFGTACVRIASEYVNTCCTWPCTKTPFLPFTSDAVTCAVNMPVLPLLSFETEERQTFITRHRVQ